MAAKVVAVSGATGQQGGATVDALLRLGGFSVRALTRDPSSNASKELAGKGVEVVRADFDDVESLKSAFQGADAVFAVTDFWKACGLDPFKEYQQGRNLVDAAKATGVSHFLWSTLEDTRPLTKGVLEPITGPYTVPHFDAKSEVAEYAKEQLGGKETLVITSIFHENLLPGAAMAPNKLPDGSFILALPAGNAKTAWCATADIGNVAAAVIAAGPEKFGGKTVPVAGDHLTWAEVGEAIAKLTGKKVVAVTPPADAWVQQVVGYGVPELAARDLANMCIYYEKVGMLGPRSVEETKAVYPDVMTLEAWLTKHKDAFEKGMA
ncbi:hypothetical protein N2152v2_002210 [Parachlorella kessleri]